MKKVRSGQVEFSDNEEEVLTEEIQKDFEKHPVFEGVEIREIGKEKIPKEIMGIINSRNGNVTLFAAVKIKKEVPQHPHTKDNEIYFGGNNGVVEMFDSEGNNIESVDLSDNSFSVVFEGENHGVKNKNNGEIVFFGIKFK